MRIRIKNELLIINICSAILILSIVVADIQALRIILGLPFLLYFPGYALIAALFPKKDSLGDFERVAFPLGLSIAITPLIGLILNYAWEIDLLPIMVLLAIFTGAMSTIGWHRRRGIPVEEQFQIHINISLSKHRNRNKLDKALSTIIVIAIATIVLAITYAILLPKQGEKFTEFYILGKNGIAEDYPSKTIKGMEETVLLGIINNERRSSTYKVELSIEGLLEKEVGPLTLEHGEKWEKEVTFSVNEACAFTELYEEINCSAESVTASCNTLHVTSVEHLKPGDFIWIGSDQSKEAANIEAIDGDTITIYEDLGKDYAKGTQVKEIAKVEFRLFKLREIMKDDSAKHTELYLWLGNNALNAEVINRGEQVANYEIEAKLKWKNKETSIVSTEPVEINQGGKWEPELDYDYPQGANIWELEFALYRDGEHLYMEKVSGGYPQLNFWISVTEDK